MIFPEISVKLKTEVLKGAIILALILAIWLSLGNHTQAVQPMVSGVVDTSDPNHPTEVYFGQASFDNLQAMLDDLGVRIFDEDKADIFPAPELNIGSKITIERALPVLVSDAGTELTRRTWEKQIKDFLIEQKIILGDKDKIEPDVSTWLRTNMKITITRVAETEITEEEAIPFKTINRDNPNLEKGKTEVIQAGKTGTKKKTYLVRRENGQEISRTLLREEVAAKPQDKIVSVGTKVVEVGRGIASWYDWISGNTAAHNTLPMGTMVRVTNLENGKSVVVKIVDRGIQTSAIIDLSADAFSQIASLGQGLIPVRLTRE